MLELRDIKKDYSVDKTAFTALKKVNLAFADKGLVAILGPSGCGKTTLLNIIGGLDKATSGDLLINGKSTKGFKDQEWDSYRNEHVGFVFQSYNLIHHMTVIDNVETSLLLNGAPKNERIKKAEIALESVGLKGSEKKLPNQLSGGQAQRVALARAIVNNPDIILADEPTGALDSKTSIQVMDILKELSKSRLVIMVTHNRELAFQYAERIIEVKDGEIVHDSKPFSPQREDNEEKLIAPKTSMTFLTALKSSFRNIRTKKFRTILTAVASSIGILGVSLVLAVSNGFQIYVDNVEGSLASSVPISISRNTVVYQGNKDPLPKEYPDEGFVNVYDGSSKSYVTHTNYFDADYVNNVLNPLVDEGLARSVLINRKNLNFNLIKKTTYTDLEGNNNVTYKSVNQYRSAGGMSSAVASVTSLPTTIFHELYGEEKGILSMYDCIYGTYPKEPTDLVLILDKYNRIDKSTLEGLGILDSKDNNQPSKISFEDIIKNGTFKAYPNSHLFFEGGSANDLQINAYKKITPKFGNGKIILEGNTSDTRTIHRFIKGGLGDSNEVIKNIYENDEIFKPLKLNIVGVLRASKDSYIQLMPTSVGYLSSLKEIFVEDAKTNCSSLHDTYEESWAIPTGMVKNTSDTYEYNEAADGRKSIEKAINSLFTLLSGEGEFSISSINAITKYISYYYPFAGLKGNNDDFFALSREVGKDYRQDLVARLVDRLQSDNEETKKEAGTALFERFLEPSFYSNFHEGEPEEREDGLDFNLFDLVAYFNSYSLITSILIFPAALTTKDALLAKLDAYNQSQETSGQILYTDIMGTFTSSLSTLIEVLSSVLIVFASISLVVSSIMTSIITYVSVIERTKEIGILRACGARKKDVGRLFQAECVIVGFIAGLIGVSFAYVACPPINAIIDHMYPGNNLSNIAFLNPLHALILIGISILLAFISGYIPARIGANKDPVIALRDQ